MTIQAARVRAINSGSGDIKLQHIGANGITVHDLDGGSTPGISNTAAGGKIEFTTTQAIVTVDSSVGQHPSRPEDAVERRPAQPPARILSNGRSDRLRARHAMTAHGLVRAAHGFYTIWANSGRRTSLSILRGRRRLRREDSAVRAFCSTSCGRMGANPMQ